MYTYLIEFFHANHGELSMREKFYRFMLGRYGIDKLGYAILIISMVISLISSVFKFYVGALISYVLLIWEVYRFLSRDTYKRSSENMKFLNIKKISTQKIKFQKNKIRDRKTHKYFECSTCHNNLRVPKGKGELKVTCPVCKTVTFTKT